jgi:ubiquinone/menaquinone biosynthesis C-methylase UbiE
VILKTNHLNLLCDPVDHSNLTEVGDLLQSAGGRQYMKDSNEIYLFATDFVNSDSLAQMNHFDRVSENYVANLEYPHTIEYMLYLDREFKSIVRSTKNENIAEICCGHGEFLKLFPNEQVTGCGVDISIKMLVEAKKTAGSKFEYIQGDATKLPLRSSSFDAVFMFGGIHHVPDRDALFGEISRILKPGGFFYFREPLNDFWLWRCIRYFIYKISPALDFETERPLRFHETVPLMEQNGLSIVSWKPCGFLGFCLFMNSDVLIFNKLFRFVPGIKYITRFSTYIDASLLKLTILRRAGLQVVGSAQKIR